MGNRKRPLRSTTKNTQTPPKKYIKTPKQIRKPLSNKSPSSSVNMAGTSINLDQLNDENPVLVQFMKQMVDSMKNVTSQLHELNGAVTKYQEENSMLQKKMDEITADLNLVKTENLALKSEIQQFHHHQAKFKVTLHGLPNNLNDKEVIKKVGELLEADVEDHHIADLYRIRTKKEGIPQPLVVSFTSRFIRKKLIDNRKKRSIFTTDLSLDTSGERKQIYLNEYLTKDVVKLLSEAKILKSNYKFEFVWAKNNIIYAKERVDSEFVYKIENQNKISEIINEISANK
jgi:hypothetical protein